MMAAEESVLLAVFADIHANRQAFGACLDARARAARSGSSASATIVGYGADPEWTVDTVMDLVDRRRHRRASATTISAVSTPSETHECRSPGRDRMDARQAQRARSGAFWRNCR